MPSHGRSGGARRPPILSECASIASILSTPSCVRPVRSCGRARPQHCLILGHLGQPADPAGRSVRGSALPGDRPRRAARSSSSRSRRRPGRCSSRRWTTRRRSRRSWPTGSDTPLPAVVGPAEHVGTFARLWSEATGVRYRLGFRERIFRLRRVVPPRPATGALRVAGPGDRDVLAEWLVAFAAEALGDDVPAVVSQVERWLAAADGRTMCLWDDSANAALMLVSLNSAIPSVEPARLQAR